MGKWFWKRGDENGFSHHLLRKQDDEKSFSDNLVVKRGDKKVRATMCKALNLNKITLHSTYIEQPQ